MENNINVQMSRMEKTLHDIMTKLQAFTLQAPCDPYQLSRRPAEVPCHTIDIHQREIQRFRDIADRQELEIYCRNKLAEFQAAGDPLSCVSWVDVDVERHQIRLTLDCNEAYTNPLQQQWRIEIVRLLDLRLSTLRDTYYYLRAMTGGSNIYRLLAKDDDNNNSIKAKKEELT